MHDAVKLAGLVLLAACKSPAPVAGGPGASADASPTPRWFDQARIYDTGPPMNATAPGISLCPDGRYVTREAYAVDASFPQPKTNGMVCCRDGEQGTYELVWSPHGVLQNIHLTSDTGAQRDLPVSPEGNVFGAAPRIDARSCRAGTM